MDNCKLINQDLSSWNFIHNFTMKLLGWSSLLCRGPDKGSKKFSLHFAEVSTNFHQFWKLNGYLN
jgi:hypothetical protein